MLPELLPVALGIACAGFFFGLLARANRKNDTTTF